MTGCEGPALSPVHRAPLVTTSSLQGMNDTPASKRQMPVSLCPEARRMGVRGIGFVYLPSGYQLSVSALSPRPLTHPVCYRRVFLFRAL